jgi:hypothetical protein
MSEPKFTLQAILDYARGVPTSPEFDLAVIEFLELPDSQQKALLFRAVVDLSAQLNWIVSELKK